MKLSVSLLLMIYMTSLFSQNVQPIPCGFDAYLEKQKQDPIRVAEMKISNKQLQEALQGRSPSCTTPEVLPVAFHFNGNIDNSNMTCLLDAAQAQIAAINEDFGGYNSDIDDYCSHSSSCPSDFAPTALGGGTCIQLCLATENHPAGFGLANGDPAFTFDEFIWDGNNDNAPGWEGYINIFVSDVSPPGVNSGAIGIAPNRGNNPDANGIWIKSEYFGGSGVNCNSGAGINTSNSLGRTGTHELGHYFNLLHTFSGCSNGDNISDTPDQDESSLGNVALNTTTCSVTLNGSTHPTTCGVLPMFQNFMDYSDDPDMVMFTSDQSDVMYAYQQLAGTGSNMAYADANSKCNSTNLGLINYNPTYPNGCPFSSPPESAFSTNTSNFTFCPLVNEITFTDESTNFPTGWNWTFSGAGVSPSSSTDQNPTIAVNSSGTLTVSLVASNAGGSDATPATMNYSITIDIPANCNDCGMTFTDSGGAAGNYSNNENTEYTFCANNGEGISFDFSTVDMAGGFLEDRLRIYDGSSVPTNTNEYLFAVGSGGVSGVWERSNFSSGSYSYVGTTYSTCSQCVSFLFTSNSSSTAAGWEATISCFDVSCSDGVQAPCEEFVDCGGPCAACPTACEGFQFTDNGGVSGNMSQTSSESYLICGDGPSGHAIIDFSSINLGSTQVYVYEGNVASGQPLYLLSGSNVFIHTSGSSYTQHNDWTLQSSGQCFTVEHSAAGAGVQGFVADVSCCDPNAIYYAESNNGDSFFETINNLKACTDTDISDATAFTNKNDAASRSCVGFEPQFGYMVFYAVEAGNNGILEIDVNANSNGGGMDLALYGPVTGTFPNHTGGGYVACSSGTNPTPVSITANAGDIYLAVIATENKGTFDIYSTSAATALPVELISWDADLKDNKVILSWETESEINNDRFVIYSSMDGSKFELLTNIESKSQNGKGAKYSFEDRLDQSGKYYYRLEQVDLDGNRTDLGIKSIGLENEELKFAVFPNPVANDRLSFTGINNTKQYEVNIISTSGRVVRNTQLNIGSHFLSIADIPAGIYFVNMQSGGEILTAKFVKLAE